MIGYLKRFKRALKWFWRGYQTEEWDYHYLFNMIRFKFEDARDFWSDPRNVYVIEKSRLRKLKQISICAFLMKRLAQDNYDNKHVHDPMEAKWGELKIIDKETLPNGYVATEIKREKVSSSAQAEQERKDLNRLIKKSNKIKEYDMELFCRIFSKHYRLWWD